MLVYGSGDLALRFSALVTIPIYTRLFDADEYGVWSFVASGVWLLNAILVLGADTAYTRQFFEARTAGARRTLTSTLLLFVGGWAALVCLALVPLAGPLSEAVFDTGRYDSMFLVALLGAPLMLVNVIANVALRNEFRAWLFAALNLGSAALAVVLSLAFVLLADSGLVGLVLGPTIAAAVALPVRLWAIRHLIRPTFSVPVLRALLRFGVPLVPASLATWVFLVSDRLLLGTLSTASQLGLYTIAAGLVSVLTLGDAAFAQAWLPRALHTFETDRAAAGALFSRALTFVLVGFGLAAVVVTAYAEEALRLLTTEDFFGAEAAVAPLALGLVAIVAARVTSIGIITSERTRWSAVIAVAAAVLNVALNLAFIPEHGMVAAAWASLATYAFVALAELIASFRLAGTRFDAPPALVAAAATAATVLTLRELEAVSAKTAVAGGGAVVLFACWRWSRARSMRTGGPARAPAPVHRETSGPTARD
jgi:O-antigen/teichoic acid export membrane protein